MAACTGDQFRIVPKATGRHSLCAPWIALMTRTTLSPSGEWSRRGRSGLAYIRSIGCKAWNWSMAAAGPRRSIDLSPGTEGRLIQSRSANSHTSKLALGLPMRSKPRPNDFSAEKGSPAGAGKRPDEPLTLLFFDLGTIYNEH